MNKGRAFTHSNTPQKLPPQSVCEQDEGKKPFLVIDRPRGDGLTGVEALHPQRQPRLGDGDELQSNVELAPPEVTQPGGSAKLSDLKQVRNIIFLS